jgi:hypothetical protein
MAVRLDEVIDWLELAIPDSAPAVRLSRLHAGADGATVSLVRFPAGWSRPATGHYTAAEEFLVLEGSIVVGDRFSPGDYAFLPPRTVRAESSSEGGALVLAWFSGPPEWRAGTPPEPAPQAPVRSNDPAGVLREAAAEVPGRYEVAASRRADDLGADVLDLRTRTWEWVEAGQVPTIEAPLLHQRTWA